MRSSEPGPRGWRTQRGAAVIEAAFVTPVFLLILFGILEYGLLFRNNLTTTNASQEAARAASVAGRSLEADFVVLRTIEFGIAAMGLENLNYVVVFNATVLGDEIPAGHPCHSGSQTGQCNYYVPSDFALELEDGSGTPTEFFRCVTDPQNIDGAWCPQDRRTGLGSDADVIGVYVNTRHQYLTGFFGEDQTLDATTLVRIEPELTP